MKNLPNDIIINIVHEAKIMRQDIVWKKRHNLMIRHLEEYLEELGDEPNPEYIYEGSMRYDIRFLENNDAWGTSLNKCICDNHGEDEFNNFADNDF
jgi:hypothetical protein|tara:strand:- start:63 stop:350 length:288 start_codon:yes stop_codon:yes gene_type:complete